MEGVRILEVAQFTFVPAAGAVLADWGADVIKVEHAERGDAQRGLIRLLGLDVASKGTSFFPIMEGPNRGKRSVGLALEKPGARRVLEELVRISDVFLTNFHGSAITAFRRNAQVKEQTKGYSITGRAGGKHAPMRIPSASSLPNEGCRCG
jgi:crotonobetainyl-CoA:carnitine CoA-transferase CaiB-like acyl-CoA transferase